MISVARLSQARATGSPLRRIGAGTLVTLALVTLALVSCSEINSVSTFEQTIDPATLYFQLTIDHRAVTLSTVTPYDTLRLTAVPRNALGEPLMDLPAPTFRLSQQTDSTRVSVTPDGVLQAHAATTGAVTVVADLLSPGGTRHVDTMYVVVNETADPPPQLATLEITPTDSAKRSMKSLAVPDIFLLPGPYRVQRIPPPRATDAAGNPVTDLLYEITSLDPTIAQVRHFIGPGFANLNVVILALRPGQARIVARTTSYGVSIADTTVLTITWPIFQSVTIAPGLIGQRPLFQPSDIRITTYGIVLWQSNVADTVDVVFEDPTNIVPGPAVICDVLTGDPASYGAGPFCAMGDMLVPGVLPEAPFYSESGGAASFRVRQFPVSGVYLYHSTRIGATGRVVVTDDPDPAALP